MRRRKFPYITSTNTPRNKNTAGRRLTKANVEYNPFTEEEKAQTETEKSFQQLLESNPDAADHFYSRKQLKQKLEDREHRLNSLQFNNFTNKLHVIELGLQGQLTFLQHIKTLTELGFRSRNFSDPVTALGITLHENISWNDRRRRM